MDALLAVNTGSSSLKFALYEVQETRLGAVLRKENQQNLKPGLEPGSAFEPSLNQLAQALQQIPGLRLRAVAHRVVHGGPDFTHATRVDETVLQRLEALNSLAPLHQPHNLAGIRAFQHIFPQVPQVACFDTAFHASLPELETRFALPEALVQQGIRRYGFHGLSYAYLMQRLQSLSTQAQGKVLMAHLGSGASLCAAYQGRSQATTMGFSALDGLMMGTRSGALDPGVLLYLLQQGWNWQQLQTLLYQRSGLLGVSGLSADMRVLRAADAPQAQLAISLFTHRVIRECGALSACLQGLEVLVFTGGIGEHDPLLRHDVCQALGYLGVQLDQKRNAHTAPGQALPLHAEGSRVEIWVIPTDEGRYAAEQALSLFGQTAL
jgi:acetate kinase